MASAFRPVGRDPEEEADLYNADDLRGLAAYAADRFVTLVPEVDTPGTSQVS
jgi:hexosaminidase